MGVLISGLVIVLGIGGCSRSLSSAESSDLGNRFETSETGDALLEDGSGNQLELGSDLSLPQEWPTNVPTPVGTLISVSVIDEHTAVATWSVVGDVFQAQQIFLVELEDGFAVESIAELTTETITVYSATGNGYEIVVSATLGEEDTDPGEITLLVNPSF